MPELRKLYEDGIKECGSEEERELFAQLRAEVIKRMPVETDDGPYRGTQ